MSTTEINYVSVSKRLCQRVFHHLKILDFHLNSPLGIANLAIYYIVPVDWIAISEFPPTNDTSDIDSQKDGMSSGSKRVATIERSRW